MGLLSQLRTAESAVLLAVVAGLLVRQARWFLLPHVSGLPVDLRGLLPLIILSFQCYYRGGLIWQLYPVVPAIAFLLFASADSANQNASTGFSSVSFLFIFLFLAALSMLLLLIFPMFQFPKLTGPHKVGFSHFEINPHTKDKPFVYYIWYPCSTASTPTSDASVPHFPHHSNQMRLLFESMQYKLPASLLFSHLQYIKPETYGDAPLLQERSAPHAKYPLVLFSHGLYGFPSLYTHMCADLASQGLVVVSNTITIYLLSLSLSLSVSSSDDEMMHLVNLDSSWTHRWVG